MACFLGPAEPTIWADYFLIETTILVLYVIRIFRIWKPRPVKWDNVLCFAIQKFGPLTNIRVTVPTKVGTPLIIVFNVN